MSMATKGHRPPIGDLIHSFGDARPWRVAERSVFSGLVFCLALLLPSCGSDSSTNPPASNLTVSITAPAADAILTGSVDIVVAATNADQVEFFVNTTLLGSDSSPPYLWTWDSTSLPNGSQQIRATATRGTETKSASISVALNNVGGGVSVILDPTSATLEPGEQQQFTATVLGHANPAVVWSIDGGGPGTLTATGLYTAPSSLPSPPTATVRAMSLADGAKSGQATVTLSDGSGLPVAELDLLRSTYTAGFDTRGAITNTNDLMMRSVFFASCQNGQQLTGSGSLVETGPDSGEFTWSPEPSDRLRIVFGTGQSVEMTFTAFGGDMNDLACDDYVVFNGNHAVDYAVTAEGVSIQIQSQVAPTSSLRTSIEQRLAGSMTLDGVLWTAEGSVSGESTFFIDVGSGFSNSTHDLQITALFTSGTTQIEASQRQTYEFSSGTTTTSTEQSDRITATGTDGAVTFTLQDVVYEWLDSNTIDPIYSGRGRVLRNGILFGEFGANSSSGQAIVTLNDGTVIEL